MANKVWQESGRAAWTLFHWVNLRVCLPGKTKVTYLSLAVFIDQHVGRLEIAVHHTRTVHEMQSTEQVVHDGLNVILG